jgi:hypothetical protein
VVRLKSFAGQELPDKFVKLMWVFRLKLIQLRPEVTLESDFAEFEKFVKKAKLNTLLFKNGDLVGMLSLAIYDMKWNARTIKIFNPDYFFLDNTLRRTFWPLLIHMRSQLYCILRYPFHKKFVVALGYPSSFISSDKLTPGFYFLGENSPSLYHEVLSHYLKNILNVGESSQKSGIVKMKTKPLEVAQVPQSESNLLRLKRYQIANPNWRDGYGIAFVTNLSFPDVIGRTVFYLAKEIIGTVRKKR